MYLHMYEQSDTSDYDIHIHSTICSYLGLSMPILSWLTLLRNGNYEDEDRELIIIVVKAYLFSVFTYLAFQVLLAAGH